MVKYFFISSQHAGTSGSGVIRGSIQVRLIFSKIATVQVKIQLIVFYLQNIHPPQVLEKIYL